MTDQKDGGTAVSESSLAELVAAELRLLRKGRGIQGPDLDRRIGPYLRELAAGTRDPEDISLRQALTEELRNRAAQLAGDLRTAILASLGLSDETRHMPHFTDRVIWLAGEIRYQYRTALRRIDTAERLLAEEIARELRHRRGQIATTPDGWYLDEFRVLLLLDGSTPESHEVRRIVATRDGLDEVIAWLDVPGESGQPAPDLRGDVLYGGVLVTRKQPADGRFAFVVQLPAPLQAGQVHEYGLKLTVPQGQPMRPHYIFTAECQCNLFDLRVRFDRKQPPSWIREVRGETVRMFDSPPPAEAGLAHPDSAGEIHRQFRNPARYLGYGLQWQL